MMRVKTGLLLLALGSWGCSGRFEVGDMNGAGGKSNAVGAGSSSGDPSGGKAGGDSPAARGGARDDPSEAVAELGPRCVPAGAPAKLTGPFAAPDVVWNRVSRLIWGELREPPSALPSETSYAWAGDVVAQAFAQARPELHAFGASEFVFRWLDPTGSGPTPEYEGGWETLLLWQSPALQVLLTQNLPLSIDNEHIGVFSEPIWLKAHPSISSRGAAIASTLLQLNVPPPPENVMNGTPSPPLTDRAAIERAVAPASCSGCHRFIDPLGYALGHFDQMGAYRELDHDQPIDTTGSYQLSHAAIEYDGVKDLGEQLWNTCDATVALADGFLRAALSIDEVPEAERAELFEASSARMRQAFVHSEVRSYEDLVRVYAQSPAVLRPQ
jgi:uncharacterized protein DUF1588